MRGQRNRYNFISTQKTEEILQSAFEILEQIGILVSSAELLSELKQLGFAATGDRVKIPQTQSRDFLDDLRRDNAGLCSEINQKRSRSRLEGVMGSYTMRFEHPLTGANELFTTESLIAATKFAAAVAEQYGSFVSFAPGYPCDVPPELDSLIKYKISAEYGAGAIPVEPTSVVAANCMFEMAQVTGQPIRRLPVYPISPLCLGGDSAEIVWRCKNQLESFYVFSMPSIGCTAPLSLSKSLALCFAEVLGCALLMREVTGLACHLRLTVNPFDLQAMNYAFGTPQKCLYDCIAEDFLAQVLDTPVNYHCANIHTNCAVSGVQSAMEKTSLMTAGASLGATKFYCIGTLSMDEVFSPAELILDAERLVQVQGLLQKPELEPLDGLLLELEEHLASGFLMSDRTLDFHEEYVRYSPLINRSGYGSYSAGNHREMLEAARAQAKTQFSKAHQRTPNAQFSAALDDIYAYALTRCR